MFFRYFKKTRNNTKPLKLLDQASYYYLFCKVPFGVKKGVACIQRVTDYMIKIGGFKGVYACLDDITDYRNYQDEHDRSLASFLTATKKYCTTELLKYCTKKYYNITMK